MAITKFERWKTSEKNSDDLAKEADGIFEKPIYEDESPAIQLLHDKVHELTDLINTHITKMAANDAKIGITTSQANAITANTAKTGITSTQATSITDNANSIAANKTALGNITTFPGFGTTKDTALKGNTYIPPIQVSLALGLILSIQIRMVPPQKGRKKGTAQLGWILEDTINRVLYQGTPQTLV